MTDERLPPSDSSFGARQNRDQIEILRLQMQLEIQKLTDRAERAQSLATAAAGDITALTRRIEAVERAIHDQANRQQTSELRLHRINEDEWSELSRMLPKLRRMDGHDRQITAMEQQQREMNAVVQKLAPFSADEKARVMALLDSSEGEAQDRKDFFNAAKTTLLTMIFCGILAPLIMFALLHFAGLH